MSREGSAVSGPRAEATGGLGDRTDEGPRRERMGPAGRPRRRGIWVAVAVLTAFVVVVPLGVQIWGRLIRQTVTTTDTYHGQPISALEIDAGPGSVWVQAGPANEVTVARTLKWALSRPRVEQSWTGGVLRITVVCGPREKLYSSLECGVGLHIGVPAGVALRATSGSGDVMASGLTGGVDVRTESGTVGLRGLGGTVRVRSLSSVIDAQELAARSVDAGSASGEIDLGFTAAPGDVRATSRSGGILVRLPHGTRYRVTATTASGPRMVDPAIAGETSARGADRRVDVHSASGAVSVQYTDP